MESADLDLASGRTLHVYRAGAGDRAVFWCHGTPNIGPPPEPLFAAADRLGIRWVSYDRPGYGGSTRNPGRDLASAGTDIAAIADDLGIDRFAVVGHSGGGSHALAAAALLGDRVTGVVSMAGLAPFTADGLDWYAGMIPSGEASLRAAAAGPAAKDRHEASDVEYDPEFTPADLAALAGPWSWLGGVAGAGMASGPGGLIDDDLAYVNPWGSDPTGIVAPTLLLHGGRDGIVPSAHGAWLAAHCPTAEWWFRPDDGHISVLNAAAPALDWLIEHG